MQHLVGKRGAAANGGLRYYLMDNEPSLGVRRIATCIPSGR